MGWTYNHQPYLAYWRDRFYLQYLSNPVGEHLPPGRTLLMTSEDGLRWSNPCVVFPEYALPEITTEKGHLPAGTGAIMHQRMGFYTAPTGRLLTLAFYSYCTSHNPGEGPNLGQGLGRVVREVYPDNTLGPIYFIRYNRHAGWNETNTDYPFYTTSGDAGFVEACDALLADKLMTLQWWEEDRAKDGFYTIDTSRGVVPKAPSLVHRPDGVVLAAWKAHAALSVDEGYSWTPLVGLSRTLRPCGAKTWVQRTADGRYALVYNHSACGNRFPMTVMTSTDCRDFDSILCLQGEVPLMRFSGHNKNIGPQYIRGIEEGNGTPPGDFLWNTYSMNKEDLWVTRTRVPVMGTVAEYVNETFDGLSGPQDLALWNLYVPQWCAVNVTDKPGRTRDQCLELRDEEPCDYVQLERIFPESRKVSIEFRVQTVQVGHGVLECEVQDRHGRRPLKLRFPDGWLAQAHQNRQADAIPVEPHTWLAFRLEVDCEARCYSVFLNEVEVTGKLFLTEPVETIERLVFRTGPVRRDVRMDHMEYEPVPFGHVTEDLPGADHRVPLSVYRIDDVKTASRP
ncbi:MAG: hypothetical protein HQ515_03915 [Phycisphaeraceae bacterium]|nr:hypothetical protein [Phycisphaeraceae bacterium]